MNNAILMVLATGLAIVLSVIAAYKIDQFLTARGCSRTVILITIFGAVAIIMGLVFGVLLP